MAIKPKPATKAQRAGLDKAKSLAELGLAGQIFIPDVAHTLAERGKRYGDFKDHAIISQELKDTMRNTPGWLMLDANKREALEMVAHKIARILNGDPEYKDSWHDIGGYAKLAEDRCNG